MRKLLALLAIVPAVGASTSAPAASPALPKGEVVFRPECFGAIETEGGRYFGGAGGSTTGSGHSGPKQRSAAKPMAPPAPPPSVSSSSVPAPTPNTTTPGTLSKDFLQNVPAGRAFQSAVETAADATAASPSLDRALKEKKVAAPVEVGGDKGWADSDRRDMAPRDQTILEGNRPVLDFGATVYLSNDDSMSLASAQRALYAVMNNLALSVSQIRPHELLNYFSFDTVTPSKDQVFDVLASAEQDGDRLSLALAVKGATPDRRGLDLTLLVDRSCSMADDGRMDYTQRGLNMMRGQLVRGDRIDVVLFDNAVCIPLENYVVGRDDPALLEQTIARMAPHGGTNLDLGLREAYRVAQGKTDVHQRNRRMMVVTDAMLNVGDVNPNTVSEIGKAFESDGIRLTGVGVGREFNDKVLDQLTEKGKGAYVFLGSEAVVDRVFGASGFASLTDTIAHDVRFALKLPASLAMERFYGEESSTVMEDIQPVNYYAGTSQLFLQDLVIKDGKAVASDPLELEITYRDARTGEPATRSFRTTVGRVLGADPHNVRKGLALMAWTDLLMADAMQGEPCGEALGTYASRAARLQEDAEVAFINGLVRSKCGDFPLPNLVTNAGVPFKVRIDADIPIDKVTLSCGTTRWQEPLSGADAVARFEIATPGVCDLTLSGRVDMTARIEVPSTGGDMRCIVRGGRVSCS